MKNYGFSLLELSIVLVIIGLIAGGIVAGASMIRAAELRAVVTEQSQFQTAVHTFRDKYLGIPGDLKNAGKFWGYPAGNISNCPSTSGSGTETCDGNGDGSILLTGNTGDYEERFTFWQHLANAELISGTYTGIQGGTGSTHSVLGENTPESKISGAGWNAATARNYTGDTEAYALDYGTFLNLGTISTNGGPWDALLTPEEAWNIDKKIDDGLPAKGKVIARHWDNTCAAADDGTHANNDLEASYKLSDDSIQCAIYFIKQF